VRVAIAILDRGLVLRLERAVGALLLVWVTLVGRLALLVSGSGVGRHSSSFL